MNYFPSPPSSPSPFEHLDDPDYVATDNEPSIVCGSCNKALGADWFCSNCHKKCSTCSRILALNTDDYCTRCWVYVPSQNAFVPRQKVPSVANIQYNLALNNVPSPPLYPTISP